VATPLHNHTYYSAYDGLSKPIDIAQRVTELNYSACACTDHDHVAGHVEFYKTMQKHGIKPLLGIETYQTVGSRRENFGGQKDKATGDKMDNFHLILLAMNNTGLRNLWAMNTEAHKTGFYYHARVDWELLQKYNEGIICTTACGLGMLQQGILGNPKVPDPEETIQRFKNIFGDRFYVELGTYPRDFQRTANIESANLARTHGIPVVYANDAHYARPDQYELHEAIMALQEQKRLSAPTKEEDPKKGRTSHAPSLYIMDENEIREHLNYLKPADVHQALANSDRIAEICNVTLPQRRKRLPVFVPDKKYSSSKEMMIDLISDAFERKVLAYGKDEDTYFHRVKNELEVIFNAGIADYLLMVRDYVYEAKRQGIMVGPGRGSIGGSLVAWLLGIHEVDPIRYGLIFERFYNAGRETSLPDIDIDFTTLGRERVKQYVAEKYGPERVAEIGTSIRLHPRSSINDVGRVLSIPMQTTKQINKIIEQAIDAGIQPSWPLIEEQYGASLSPYEQDNPLLFEWAKTLGESSPSSKDEHIKTFGIHASGVLIADEPLAENFPVRWVAKEKKLVTQWDMEVAEEFGYMKADLLGLRNLDTLAEVNSILESTGREPIDYEALQYQDHPGEMWSLLDRGLSVGLFQVEEGGMAKQIAKQLKARSLDDLAVIVAMNRPGPLRSGALEKFMTGRNGGGLSTLHPLVERVTEETYGVFLYQEQVIRFMTELGYTLQEADDIRSLMGKKKVEKLDEEYPRYMERAKQHMSESTANLIWQDLIGFAKYAFNKSHAVQYGMILLWTLYAKWKYPIEFVTASIRTAKKEKKKRYIYDAKKLDIKVYPPILGTSSAVADISGNGILLGYTDINGFGIQSARWMEENVKQHLSKAEFCELINGTSLVNQGHVNILEALGMFVDSDPIEYTRQLELEEEHLKVAVSDNSTEILQQYADTIGEHCTEFALIEEAGEYNVAGIIEEIKISKTKQNKPYAKITLNDGTDELQFFVWNENLKRLDFIFRRRTAGIFNIKKNDKGISLLDAVILYPKKVGTTEYELSNVSQED
jgi:DNA polymerase-3 subunit alpha